MQWEDIDVWWYDDKVFQARFDEYGSNKVYLEYYNEVLQMAQTGFYNIVGIWIYQKNSVYARGSRPCLGENVGHSGCCSTV